MQALCATSSEVETEFNQEKDTISTISSSCLALLPWNTSDVRLTHSYSFAGSRRWQITYALLHGSKRPRRPAISRLIQAHVHHPAGRIDLAEVAVDMEARKPVLSSIVTTRET